MTEARKPVNSHELARAHGKVHASVLWPSGGYDSCYRDGKPAHWALWAPNGASWRTPEPGEKISSLLSRRPHVFVSFDDLAEYAQRACGVSGWTRDKWGGWHPNDSSTDRPCGVSITTGGRASRHGVCDRRRKEGETMCGQHLAAARRRAESDRAEAERRASSESGSKIADDAVEWLDRIGVKATTHYHVPIGSGMGRYTGEVRVHAEDVISLVREVIEAREVRELL